MMSNLQSVIRRTEVITMVELQTIYMDIKIYTSNRFKWVMAYLIERNKKLKAIDIDIKYIIDKLMSKHINTFGSISSANIQTNTLIVLYIFNKSLGSDPFKFYQENQQYYHD
ncbi:hypothetical protein [Candidatus Hodgkinia cicadicola]|uniref:hypothetical protein n=1 Tax=Candidatus Hodgkinia cicadicola TaxID=573658 RepID=UPI0011BA858A